METSSFDRETASIVEAAVQTTTAVIRGEWENDAPCRGWDEGRHPGILQDMGNELIAKITKLFGDVSSSLLKENQSLKVEVAQLEGELKSNVQAGLLLEKQLRTQVGRLRREVGLLEKELKKVTESCERNRAVVDKERRERTLTGPVHILLQNGSLLGE